MKGVMLATQSKEFSEFGSTPVEVINSLAATGEWFFELKWDGHRCLATRDEQGTIRLTARSGADVTDRYPELAEDLDRVVDTGAPFVLDGEVVAFGSDGNPDFNLLAKRKTGSLAKARALVDRVPVSFVVFDVLELNSHDYREVVYGLRQQVLETLHIEGKLLRSPRSRDGAAYWRMVQDRDLEGLVAKHEFSVYRSGRHKTWIKLRRTTSASFVVTGYEPGTGWAEGLVGALLLSVYKGDELIQIGKVGTGFTKKDRTDLLGLMHEHFIVEVEYQELTPDGLRFPSYRGPRWDIELSDCTYDQLI